jgi:hypothetical protein
LDLAMPGNPGAKELPNATNSEQLFACGALLVLMGLCST